MSEEGFMEWLSVEDISSKPKEKRVSVFGIPSQSNKGNTRI